MATDPVEVVQTQTFATRFTLDLHAALNRLAALPPSTDAPYLTLSLDWRPQGDKPNRRPARTVFDQAAEQLIEQYRAHTTGHASVTADVRRIRAYLDDDLPAAAHGAFVVACSARGVFEPLALGLPLDTRLMAGPIPALFRLAHLADDHPTYALLRVDQKAATLLTVRQAAPERHVLLQNPLLEMEADDYPPHQQQGGWSQKRYQDRAETRVAAFARRIAEETRRMLDETHIKQVLLAGDDVMTIPLLAELPQAIRDRVAGVLRVADDASDAEAVRASAPLMERVEREQEAETVRVLRNTLAAGGPAVGGAQDVLTALQAGQVMTLAVTSDFGGPGWADFTFPLYGAGKAPAEHPAGGDPRNITPAPLEELLILLAIQTGASIEIVPAATRNSDRVQQVAPDKIDEAAEAEAHPPTADALKAVGGVGATLRFALDEQQPTADL